MPVTPLWKNMLHQRGVFSPFMFGLLTAIGIFSILAQQWAKQDLIRLEEERQARMERTAEDIAQAVEFALLTETASTFDQNITLDRIKQFTTEAGGLVPTDDIQLTAHRSEQAFDLTNQTIAIGVTEDPFAGHQFTQTYDEDAVRNSAAEQGIEVIDTSAIRQRQIQRSMDSLETMASHVYDFYAGHLRFPNDDEYEKLEAVFKGQDAWGSPLSYTFQTENTAELAFVTPWGFRQTVKLAIGE